MNNIRAMHIYWWQEESPILLAKSYAIKSKFKADPI